MAHSYHPHTNVYRPSYGTVRPQTPAGNSLNYDNADVNRIPLIPRRRPTAGPAQPPQPRDDHLDPFIHRTIRAYDLVTNYARDSAGGTRWSREDINGIKHAGRYLHGDVRDLKHWKEVVAQGGDMDEGAMGRVWDDEERLKKYCERILDVIRETERVPLRQRMTRGDGDGVRDGEELTDQPIDARSANWATKPSTRFAW